MLKHTKIVATISDKRCEVDFLQKLFDEGMNVVRLNSAHLDDEGLTKIITNTRLARAFIQAFCSMDVDDIEIKSWDEFH